MRRIRPRLTYANVMATIAVFAVLGGGAYAASKIGPNDIKKNAVRAKHIKKNQVRSKHIKSGQVKQAEIKDGAVGTGKLSLNAQGVALAGARVNSSGTVLRFFNRFGGEPTVSHNSTGLYTLTFPGLEGEFHVNDSIVLATRTGAAGGEISVNSQGSNPQVRTFESDGTLVNDHFEVVAFRRSP